MLQSSIVVNFISASFNTLSSFSLSSPSIVNICSDGNILIRSKLILLSAAKISKRFLYLDSPLLSASLTET